MTITKTTTTNTRPALGHYDEAKAAQCRAYAAAGRWATAQLHAGTIRGDGLRAAIKAELARLEAGHDK